MSEQGYAGPIRTWQFFKSRDDGGCSRYLLGYYSLLHWEFSDGCKGGSGRTPWTAWWRWNRWRKVTVTPLGITEDEEAEGLEALQRASAESWDEWATEEGRP